MHLERVTVAGNQAGAPDAQLIDAPGAARLAVRLLAFPLLDCGLCSGFAMIHGDGAAVWAAEH